MQDVTYPPYSMSANLKVALYKSLKVLVYSGLSTVGPVWVAYIQNKPEYAALVPLVNALLYGVLRIVKETWPESAVAKVI